MNDRRKSDEPKTRVRGSRQGGKPQKKSLQNKDLEGKARPTESEKCQSAVELNRKYHPPTGTEVNGGPRGFAQLACKCIQTGTSKEGTYRGRSAGIREKSKTPPTRLKIWERSKSNVLSESQNHPFDAGAGPLSQKLRGPTMYNGFTRVPKLKMKESGV